MGYFGLSSSHCLTSIWLLETGWWGKTVLEGDFPTLLYAWFSFARDFGVTHHVFMTSYFFLLTLSKFGSQFLLGFAFVRNHTGQSRLLKAWYWMGIITDLVLLTSVLVMRLTQPNTFGLVDNVIMLIQFPLLRGGVWIFVTKLISEVSAEEKPLVGLSLDRSRIGLTVSTVLAWEVIWYTLMTLSLLEAQFYGGQIVLVTIPNGFPPTIVLLNSMNVLGAVFLWVAISQNRRVFLIFWLPVYVLLNVVGYSAASYWEATEDFARHWLDGLPFVAFQTAKYELWLCAVVLKIGVVIGSIVFLCKSETTQGGGEYKEIQPLITSEK